MTVVPEPDILARGPWAPEDVVARWSDEHFVPPPEAAAEADLAIEALKRRGSPSHDGLAARLVDFVQVDGRLELDLQPLRWSLRLVPGDAAASISALCVTRAHDGRWLAGRRAA
jgi:8-oxo-dGTP diphosphatase